ncbi:hypothetical protein, partial [Pyrobaculum sp.]|uniref:hypothetical protein n=1 Tax=Pyrobaculum sp. TaxID=2004705 RepID=UPI003D0F3BFE
MEKKVLEDPEVKKILDAVAAVNAAAQSGDRQKYAEARRQLLSLLGLPETASHEEVNRVLKERFESVFKQAWQRAWQSELAPLQAQLDAVRAAGARLSQLTDQYNELVKQAQIDVDVLKKMGYFTPAVKIEGDLDKDRVVKRDSFKQLLGEMERSKLDKVKLVVKVKTDAGEAYREVYVTKDVVKAMADSDAVVFTPSGGVVLVKDGGKTKLLLGTAGFGQTWDAATLKLAADYDMAKKLGGVLADSGQSQNRFSFIPMWRASGFTPPLNQGGTALPPPMQRELDVYKSWIYGGEGYASLALGLLEATGLPTAKNIIEALATGKPYEQVEREYYEWLTKNTTFGAMGYKPEEVRDIAETYSLTASAIMLPAAGPAGLTKEGLTQMLRNFAIGGGAFAGAATGIGALQGRPLGELGQIALESFLSGGVLTDIGAALKGALRGGLKGINIPQKDLGKSL